MRQLIGGFMNRFALLCAIVSTAALAQDFDAANKQLAEKSNSRACESFTAFLKANPSAPQAREATAKKAWACANVGKGSLDELRKIADAGEKDFARAWALAMLFERGERALDLALPLLKQAANGTDRVATEARALLVTSTLTDMDRNQWNVALVEQRAAVAVEYARDEGEKATARYRLAMARLNSSTKVPEAEAALTELGAGNTALADDALMQLARRRENDHKFTAALALFDEIVRRFSPTTSNVRSDADSRAKEIRRPWISVSGQYTELPGVKPQVSLSWRNVKNGKFALSRVDPLAAPAGLYPDDADDYLRTATAKVKDWSKSLEVPVPYEQGSLTLDIDAAEPGAYVLEATADGQRSTTWLLVTQTAIATLTDDKKLYVFVSDVETGQKKPDAEVAVFIAHSGGHQKLTGKTDADGVATFTVEHTSDSMQVWSHAGSSFAFATAGSVYNGSWYKEYLAYALADRPLYKPGETVGLTIFLRSREGGPSAPMAGKPVHLIISDPQGKQALDQTITTNQFGSATVSVPLAKNATLGAWSIRLTSNEYNYRLQNAVFRVEEYKPPEYTVSVEPVAVGRPGEPVRAKIKASFYSGGPVANATGRALVTVRPWQHTFAPWKNTDDQNGDEANDEEGGSYRNRRYNPWGSQTLAQHTLPFKTGADGTAEISMPAVDASMGYDSFEYSLQVLVTDASRREIQGTGSVKVSRAPYFLDVRTGHDIYRPGERVNVELRAEDANGKPVATDVVVRLSRIAEDGHLAKVSEARTRVVAGKGVAVLDADAVGQARVEVLDPSGGQEKVVAQSDLWLTSDTKPLAPPAQGFRVYVDRAPLKAGQKLRALVASNRAGGEAFVSIENDAVQAMKVVSLKGRAAFIELPLTAAMAPNAWLNVIRFEDANGLQQQLPIRVAGSEVEFPVSVDFGRASAEPGSKVTANVQTRNAPAAAAKELTLSVIDEALFAIEPEKKDFLSFFGRTQRQMRVRTSLSMNSRSYRQRPAPVTPVEKKPQDSRPDTAKDKADNKLAEDVGSSRGAPAPSAAPAMKASVADSMGPSAERRKEKKSASDDRDEESAAAPGGGVAQPDAPVKVRTDFGSSAGWFTQVPMKGERFSQEVTLKDSLTSWKAIATVVTDGPALGQGGGSIRTAKALMVRLQAPRFFVEGDEVVISAVVESHLAKVTDVEVTITAPGFKELTPGRKTVKVEPEQTLRVDARFKVVELGERTLRATVKGGGTSDGMEWKLPAFVHGSAQRQFFTGRLKDVQTFEFDLPEKRKATLTRLELGLSPSLLAVMFDGLPYLSAYPYGCVEQTLSRFVPATIARRAVKDLHLPADRVPPDLDDQTQKGLDRLASFQHGDGGWGWWQTDTTNDWMTAYVIYALSLAKDAGLAVRPELISRGRQFLVEHLGRELDTPETHAFMVFALAQTGGAPKPAVDTLFSRRSSLSARARAQLALSLLATRDARARIAVENLDDVVKAAQSRPDASVGEANDAWSTSAAIEATAFTLMAYARYDRSSPLIAPLTDFLVLRRNGGRWRNTRDTAFAIYALSDLARLEKAAQAGATFVVTINGKEVKRLRVEHGGLDLKEAMVFSDASFKAGKNVVQIARDGAGTGYWSGTFDVFNMNDFIKGVGGDVKLKRTYTLLGKPSAATDKTTLAGEYGMPVESGVRVRVDLELTANKAVEFVMVEDLKPAGFESVELRSGPQVCNNACAHAELRTDRVAMFVTAIPVGTTRLSYELRAEVPGRFAALPARMEAMYAPELQSTADEMRFEVRDEPSGVAAH
jgi:hypothetical protein